MKKIFLIALVLVTTTLVAQDTKLAKWVVGSGGMNFVPNSDGNFMYGTMGQPAIGKVADATLVDDDKGIVGGQFVYGFWKVRFDVTSANEVITPERLISNYPNPFRQTTTVKFELKTSAEVSLRVFDVNGRLVRTLIQSEFRSNGVSEILWDGKYDSGMQAGSGSYLYELNVRPFGGSNSNEYILRDVMVLSK